MKSITKHIDANILAAQIRMLRPAAAGALMLVEGDTDSKRFEKIFDNAQIIVCFGKKNALGAIQIVRKWGIPGTLAMVDADFDRVLDVSKETNDVIYSDGYDYDFDMVTSGALDDVLFQITRRRDNDKCCQDIINEAIRAISAWSLFCLFCHSEKISLQQSVNIHMFLNNQINIDTVDRIQSQFQLFGIDVDMICRFVKFAKSRAFQLEHLICGHDFFHAIRFVLKKGNISTEIDPTAGSLEVMTRISFSREHVGKTGLRAKLESWSRQNPRFALERS